MAKSTNKPVVVEKDLQKTLADLRKELGDARRGLSANELPNPRVITKTRREIARTLTAINASKKKEAQNA